MRAKLPTSEGFVDRDGVKIHYEVYGDGPETMVFVPAWAIVTSRIYKAQLPYFSQRFRCIAYDPRGNGKSDRPAEPAAHTMEQHLADLIAVMDATMDSRTYAPPPACARTMGSFGNLRAGAMNSDGNENGAPVPVWAITGSLCWSAVSKKNSLRSEVGLSG